ncbi:hypothetical protein EON68_02520, partial [archaeon]
DVARMHKNKRFDLIMAHYSLSELCTDRERDAALADLWDMLSDGGVLVLAEHGDRWGFRVVQRSRDLLLQRATALARFAPQLKADRPPLPGAVAHVAASSSAQEGAAHGAPGGSFSTPATDTAGAAHSSSAAHLASPDMLSKLQDADFVEYPPELSAAVASATAALTSPPPEALQHLAGKQSADAPALAERTLPTVAEVRRHLKSWMKKHSNSLRPPADTSGTAVIGPCAHALAV